MEIKRMKLKRVRLQVEWTDVVVRKLGITMGGVKPALVPLRVSGNYHRATRSATRGPRRMIQIFA